MNIPIFGQSQPGASSQSSFQGFNPLSIATLLGGKGTSPGGGLPNIVPPAPGFNTNGKFSLKSALLPGIGGMF